MTLMDQRREALVAEVDALLQAGDVGLYEFIWVLNDADGLSTAERETIAYDAVARMLATGRTFLVWKSWDDPDFTDSAVPSLADITSETWQPPTADPYLAIDAF